MITALAVLARVVANPVSNVFQKRLAQGSASPLFIIAATHVLLSVVCVPALVFTGLDARGGFWVDISICAVLAVSSNVLLVYALHSGDLSVLGPINAYKPVVALAAGILLVGEVPTRMGVAGIALIVAGSYFVAERGKGSVRIVRLFGSRAVQLRFAALVLSATEAVFLKRALLQSTPLVTFLVWSILGVPVAVAFLSMLGGARVRQEAAVAREQWKTYVMLAFATGAMQSATLFTFDKLQVGYSLALFQLSAVVSVLLGYRYFGEPSFRKRLTGSVVMAAGAALIIAFGRG